MIARGAVLGIAALAAFGLPPADTALAQGMILSIEIQGSNPRPVRPAARVNTLREFMAAFAECWSPPLLSRDRQPVDVTFQVSFKRSGELFGKPRVVSFARQVTPEERDRYHMAVVEAIDR